MSFFDVKKEDIESFTLVTNPKRYYRSSSIESDDLPHGVTGSMFLSSHRTSCIKDTSLVNEITSSKFIDNSISVFLSTLTKQSSTDISSKLEHYMELVRSSSTSEIETNEAQIERFKPSYDLTENTLRKLNIKDSLNSYYRSRYPTAHWAYTNYNSLNFFTSSAVPSDSALLYPSTGGASNGFVSGSYALTGAFSFFFKIKPTQKGGIDQDYKAGTIYHMSSCYAISLLSGSISDGNGRPEKFKLMLQLSHSAEVPPSIAEAGAYPNDLIFVSDDNCIDYNEWNDVVVRWGTSLIDDGTGSFVVNGVEKGTFVVPSSTVAPAVFSDSSQPDVLFVGNFYEGTNTGNASTSYFFSANAARRYGLVELNGDTSIDEPSAYTLDHPLNAEVHELKVSTKYYNNHDILSAMTGGLHSIPDDIVFYVPPFFTRESPIRRHVGDHGGIMTTPFNEVDGTTIDPFNVALSFGVAGHDINLENFVRDFSTKNYPLLLSLTGSITSSVDDVKTANEFLYSSGSFRKRNLTVLPCDDGNFDPNFSLLTSGTTTTMSKYVNDLGVRDLSLVSLDNLCRSDSIVFKTSFDTVTADGKLTSSNDFITELYGPKPENPTIALGPAVLNFNTRLTQSIINATFEAEDLRSAPYTIYQKTSDPSSNEIVMFSIDDLYYGTSIRPGTFSMSDASLSGSGGAVSVKIKDDGYGNLYRDNTDSESGPTWNSVGNIYYDEGIVLIKSPHLSFFGENQFDMSFEGTQNVHVLALDVLALGGTLNSSSNPTYDTFISASGYPNDPDSKFVYLTTLNLHDDNYNVVARAHLAQPIVKRFSDSLCFRVKIDF